MSIISQSTRTFFNGTNVTATTNFAYNATLNTGAAYGWKTARADVISVRTRVATLNASYLTYRVEGRMSSGYDSIASIAVGSLNTAKSIDNIITIQNTIHADEIRIGFKANNAASPNNAYAGLILTEKK